MTDVSGIECSPGTFVLHDAGYGPKYADLAGITPAAVLITRVVSRPTPNRVTLDLGNKSVAADPVLEKRVTLLDSPSTRRWGTTRSTSSSKPRARIATSQVTSSTRSRATSARRWR